MTLAPPAERAALARAVALAETARARTSPNPAVGCVLLREGQMVGEGVTAPTGGSHAEVAALRQAGERGRGATAVVTLEPCAHHGRTPPCVAALAEAGVSRVVFAQADPNPTAAGGAAALAAAGIEVVGPLPPDDPLAQAVALQLEGFLTVVRTGRPHVTLKLAQTLDGGLSAPDGARWVTGVLARRAVHRWRASVDAVLVGSGTVLADDPRLDARRVPTERQPRPVVFDARLRTPPTAVVVRRGALVVGAPAAPVERERRLVAAGATVVRVPAAGQVGVDVPAALRAVAAAGISAVLAEPGPTLAASLVAAGVVDRLVLHVADGDRGVEPRRAVGDPPGSRWRAERVGGAGADLVLHLVPAAGSAREAA